MNTKSLPTSLVEARSGAPSALKSADTSPDALMPEARSSRRHGRGAPLTSTDVVPPPRPPPAAVEIADRHAGQIALHRIRDRRQEGAVSLVEEHRRRAAGAPGHEIGPVISVQVPGRDRPRVGMELVSHGGREATVLVDEHN